MDLQELKDTFDLLGEWDARYDFISDLGAGTEGIPPNSTRTKTACWAA